MKLSRQVLRMSFADLPDLQQKMRQTGFVWVRDVEPLFELLEISERLCKKAATCLADERAKTAVLRSALIECRTYIEASRSDPFEKVVGLLAEVRGAAGNSIRVQNSQLPDVSEKAAGLFTDEPRASGSPKLKACPGILKTSRPNVRRA